MTNDLQARIKALEEKLDKAKEALRFYADQENWKERRNPDWPSLYLSPVENDSGNLAKEAIKELEE